MVLIRRGDTWPYRMYRGNTEVKRVFQGDRYAWPQLYYFADGFDVSTINPNWVISGGALNATGGSVGISGLTDGERLMRWNPNGTNTDDVHLQVKFGTNGTRNTSIVFRLAWDWSRFVAMNFINGTCYLQRVRADGSISDITSAACNTASGTTIDMYAVGNNYRLMRNSTTQVFNVNDTGIGAQLGWGYRGFGMRFTRQSSANSPRVDYFTIEDYRAA